jgi:hypothetical protein
MLINEQDYILSKVPGLKCSLMTDHGAVVGVLSS